jgi:AraC family transcriptional regulator
MTVMKFIGMRRVERSKKLMQVTGMPLVQIAHDCGFSSQSHFTGVFKLDTGTTPAAYRNAVI